MVNNFISRDVIYVHYIYIDSCIARTKSLFYVRKGKTKTKDKEKKAV